MLVVLCLQFVCDEHTAASWLHQYAENLGVKEPWAKPKQGPLRLVLGKFNVNEIQRMTSLLDPSVVKLEVQ